MSRRRPALLMVALGLIATAAVLPAAQNTVSVSSLYDVYLSGNYNAVPAAFRTRQDFQRLRSELFKQIDVWNSAPANAKWSPSQAAFLLEVAFAVVESDQGAGFVVLEAARDMVTHRLDRPGQNADGDRFEIAFHRTAVAGLYPFPSAAQLYLNGIAVRVSALAARPENSASAARLRLSSAIQREIMTRPLAADTSAAEVVATRNRAVMNAALAGYDALRDMPEDIAAEVDVRRGWLFHRLGRQDRALEALDRGVAHATDPTVVYWSWLARGHTLEAMDRPGDALGAYQQASWIMPSAQTPAIALAVLSLRLDRREAAMDWAALARSMPERAVDPWWQYWFGDLRFLSRLLAELRRARP